MRQIPRDKTFVDKLIQEYNMNPSVRRLSQVFGISYPTIFRVLKEAGVRMPKGRGRSVKEMSRYDNMVLNIKAMIAEGTLTELEAIKKYKAYQESEGYKGNADDQYSIPFMALGVTSAEFITRSGVASDINGDVMTWDRGHGRRKHTAKLPIDYLINRGRKRENDGSPRYTPEEFLEKYGPCSMNTEEDKAIMIREAEATRLSLVAV